MDTYEKKYNEAMLRADEAVQKGCLDKATFDIIFPPEESEDERISIYCVEPTENGKPIEIPKERKDFKKLYEDALGWMREVYPNLEGAAKEDAEHYFPELAESEDERIRKAIIHYILYETKGTISEATEHTWVKWLEKQKEPKQTDLPAGFYYIDLDGNKYYSKEFRYGDMKVKVGEQKPNIEICPHSIKSKSYKENGYPIEDCDYGLEIALDILEKTLGKVYGFQTDDGIREHQTAIKAVKDAMKEQKPISTEDMPYVADEHFFEREPADSFKYRLAEYMTKNCTKGEGPYGYSYNISSESILQMAKEELIKRGELKEQKPAWSEEDDKIRNAILGFLNPDKGGTKYSSNAELVEWSNWLKSLRPPFKPTEEQMTMLRAVLNDPNNAGAESCQLALTDLYEQLKKL